MKLRPALIEDVEAFAVLEALCFGPQQWSVEQIHASLALETTYGWEIVEDDTIAGYVLVQRAGSETDILTLAVHPDYQKRGFGRLLVQEVIKTTGAGAVFLEVAADNVAAIRLYESCGFTITGRRVGYYQRGEGRVDAITYRYIATA